MSKKIFLSSFVLISAFFLTGCSLKNNPAPNITPTPTIVSQSSLKITYPCLKDKTAFDSLNTSGNKIEFQSTSLGKMVTSINGVVQSDGKYWQYSIDDQYAQVGADAYKCKGGEIISWELK